MRKFKITKAEGGSAFAVRVVPRASKDEIVGLHDNALKIKVTAPPVEGAANEAVIKLLAEKLDIPKSKLEIAAGATSRQKVVCVLGLLPEEVERRLLG